jgi:uncharacterized coiled-coil protein SlyX
VQVELSSSLDASLSEAAALRATSEHEQATLREEVERQQALVVHSREMAAGNAVLMNGQVTTLTAQLNGAMCENERLKRELDEARSNFSVLGTRTRESESRLQVEQQRLNSVVERLGGEAAESRTVMLGRIEALTSEREKTVGNLSRQLAEVTADRDEKTKHLREVIDKLRWLQTKALADGSVPPGRHRSMLYWESLKSSSADVQEESGRDAVSWRTDHDDSGFSRLIALEHRLAADGYGGEAR